MTGAPTVLDVVMSEREWQDLVVQYARLHKWWVFHPYDSRKSAPGWPDLVLLRPPRIVVAELKSERGKVSAAQERVLALLDECGVDARVWRPSDWDDVAETLGAAA